MIAQRWWFLVKRRDIASFRDFDCETGSLDESMENIERGSLASFGRWAGDWYPTMLMLSSLTSGGTTDSESRPQLPSSQNVAGQHGQPTEKLVSKIPACRPPPRAPPPTASKEKEAKKEEVVVGSKEVVVEEEEEEKEEEKLPPAMNAMDPAKRLDRLVSFLKLWTRSQTQSNVQFYSCTNVHLVTTSKSLCLLINH